jgi:hypothetical protein
MLHTPTPTHTQTPIFHHIYTSTVLVFFVCGCACRSTCTPPIYTIDAAGCYIAQVGPAPQQASHVPHTYTKHTHTHTPVRHCKKSIFVPAVLGPGHAAQSVEAKQGFMHQARPQLQLQHGGSGAWAADSGLCVHSQVKRQLAADFLLFLSVIYIYSRCTLIAPRRTIILVPTWPCLSQAITSSHAAGQSTAQMKRWK